MRDVVVIGAGLAGLTAALRAARAGASVALIAKGAGGLGLSQGTIDILGYAPDRVARPLASLASLPASHPYATLTADAVGASVGWLAGEVGEDLLVGDPASNLHLPTALGAIRPTALAQPSMLPGVVVGGRRYAVVGIAQVKDFPADLIAGNLARSQAPDGAALGAAASWIDLPARAGEADASGLTYARAVDDPGFARRFADAVGAAAGEADVILVPAVLGLSRPGVWAEVTRQLGRPIAEVPLQPPSVAGLRLDRALTALAKAAGVRVILGSFVTGFAASGGRLESVTYAAAGGGRALRGASFVYAPGGFESGSLGVDGYGAITERVFGLPLTSDRADGLISADYSAPQELFKVGVTTDASGRPLGEGGPVYANLYAAGGIIGGAQRWREKSGDGIAVATAVRAADAAMGGAR